MAAHPQSSVQKALARASALGGSTRVTWAGGQSWRVKGAHGRYTVTAPDWNWREWTCTCEAGRRGLIACKHRGCVLSRLAQDSSRGKMIEREN